MMLEIFQHLLCLLGPLELIVAFEQFEEGYSLFSKSRNKSIQGRHIACELLDILDRSWSVHVCNGSDLLQVCFNSSVTNNETE
jgi:hypothetical protein